ncbi:hypothetical protein JQ543_19150 [Bradyrhizobium diazoefficiens]|nr:hypothetical protein [Bradyrhizobium diazoefficiens]MBR0849879.1 hypothetical protein [Bradyrhizobium diazoefficiens]
MVSIGSMRATAPAVLKSVPATETAASAAKTARATPHVNAASSYSFGPGASDALGRIKEFVKQQDATKGGTTRSTPADEAIALVKSWVSSGMFTDAASGPTLPALSAEQQSQLSPQEYRVYAEVRALQSTYNKLV